MHFSNNCMHAPYIVHLSMILNLLLKLTMGNSLDCGDRLSVLRISITILDWKSPLTSSPESSPVGRFRNLKLKGLVTFFQNGISICQGIYCFNSWQTVSWPISQPIFRRMNINFIPQNSFLHPFLFWRNISICAQKKIISGPLLRVLYCGV